MVHALRQARRVLKDDGYLLDVRSAATVRHVGIESNDSYHQVAVMKESLDENYASDRAVKEMIKERLLKLESHTRVECTRRMVTYNEFETWLREPARFRKLKSPERLLKAVKDALKSQSDVSKARKGKVDRGKLRIVVLGPLDLRVLTKPASTIRRV